MFIHLDVVALISWTRDENDWLGWMPTRICIWSGMLFICNILCLLSCTTAVTYLCNSSSHDDSINAARNLTAKTKWIWLWVYVLGKAFYEIINEWNNQTRCFNQFYSGIMHCTRRPDGTLLWDNWMLPTSCPDGTGRILIRGIDEMQADWASGKCPSFHRHGLSVYYHFFNKHCICDK